MAGRHGGTVAGDNQWRDHLRRKSPELQYPLPGPSIRSQERNGRYGPDHDLRLLADTAIIYAERREDMHPDVTRHLPLPFSGTQPSSVRYPGNAWETPPSGTRTSASTSEHYSSPAFAPPFHLPHPSGSSGQSTWPPDLGPLMSDGSHLNQRAISHQRTVYPLDYLGPSRSHHVCESATTQPQVNHQPSAQSSTSGVLPDDDSELMSGYSMPVFLPHPPSQTKEFQLVAARQAATATEFQHVQIPPALMPLDRRIPGLRYVCACGVGMDGSEQAIFAHLRHDHKFGGRSGKMLLRSSGHFHCPFERCGNDSKTLAHLSYHIGSVHFSSLGALCRVCWRGFARYEDALTHMKGSYCLGPGSGVAYWPSDAMEKVKNIDDLMKLLGLWARSLLAIRRPQNATETLMRVLQITRLQAKRMLHISRTGRGHLWPPPPASMEEGA